MKKHNTTQVMNVTGSPKENSQVERVNRALTPMLAKLSEPLNHANWARTIVKVEFAINNTIQSSTEFSLAILFFGTPQKRMIIDELTEFLEQKGNEDNVNSTDLGKIALKYKESTIRKSFNKIHK